MSDTKEETTTTTTPVEEKKEETTTTTAAPAVVEEEKKEEKSADNLSEDASREFAPTLDLKEEVKTKTNEEDEEVLFVKRAKLYRFVKEPQDQWNERGTGEVKFLKHKTTNKIRIVMRREKIFKVCLNHMVSPALTLKPMTGSDKSWLWNAVDFAEEEAGKFEILCIRFGTPEIANEFKEKFEEYQKENEKLSSEN
ncbi:hypothetical protein CYY_003600 [Polysphondylium violaceum]|uniref:RanBD1 domain-containing protein n=1 Tax=Polysphondylium violaceum TaxID=133409 RepID=A0A8J4PXG0_9MYCE|nr:hypothetical protein CYY_003600 [Polysphondylium violaceum]